MKNGHPAIIYYAPFPNDGVSEKQHAIAQVLIM